MRDEGWYARCLLGAIAHPRVREVAREQGESIWPAGAIREIARDVLVEQLPATAIYAKHRGTDLSWFATLLTFESGTPSEEGALEMLREAMWIAARPAVLERITFASAMTASNSFGATDLGKELKSVLETLRGIVTAGRPRKAKR